MTDARGLPLEGVCVGVDWLLRPFADAASVRTDALGRYTVEDVPAGGHFVTFNVCDDPLPGHAGTWWPDRPGLVGAEPVVVEPGATVAGVDGSLGASGTIRGTLTDEADNAPLQGDCVTAIDRQTFAIAQSRSREDGQYALAAVAPGAYVIGFTDCSAPHHSIGEYFDDVTMPDFAAGQEPAEVAVAAGDEVVADAALTRGGAVTGTVTATHTGQAVPLACVALVPSTAEQPLPMYTGLSSVDPAGARSDDDRFVVGAVPAGSYQVQFLGQGYSPAGYREGWYGGASRAAADVVEVEVGATLEGIDAVLHPAPSIQMACQGSESGGFRDVDGSNPHADAIGCLTASDVVAGKSASRYAPAAPVRRDQMASFLARTMRALGAALPDDAPDRFSDDNGNVHEQAINQMAALGIISGIGRDRYGPGIRVTRAQMATLLTKTYEIATGYTLRSTRDWFTDDASSPHHGRINHAATAGIATGVARRRFAPGGAVRRDQVASFLARTIDRATRDTLHLQFPSPAEASPAATASGPSAALRMRYDPSLLLSRRGAGSSPGAP